MTTTRLQKLTLGIAGATALGIGAAIVVAPQAFYAGYGIALGTDPNLLSELRAPAAGLAALGAIMLAGAFRPTWTPVSATVALAVFLAFPAGRLVGIALDGLPSSAVLGALAIELAIGLLCVAAFRRRPSATTSAGGGATAERAVPARR